MSLVAIGWVVCAGLVALVVTRHLHMVAAVDEGAGLAVGYDALPILLLGAWIVTIAALVTRHWLLAAVGAVLCLYHVSIVVPRMIAARVPRWAKHAPTLDIVVANVFVDNETPDAAARQLVAVVGRCGDHRRVDHGLHERVRRRRRPGDVPASSQ